jgi:hypothetical protein
MDTEEKPGNAYSDAIWDLISGKFGTRLCGIWVP